MDSLAASRNGCCLASMLGIDYQEPIGMSAENRENVNKKIGEVYAHVAAGLTITFVAAAAISYTPLAGMVITAMVASPFITLITAVAIGAGLIWAIHSTSVDNMDQKRLLGAVFAVFQGVILSPLVVFNAPVFALAGLAATTLTGVLGVIGMKTNIDFGRFQQITFIALAVITVASIGGLFVPALAGAAYEMSLWAGVSFFSAFVVWDTQKAREEATRLELAPGSTLESFDTVGHAAGIYLDVLNLMLKLYALMNNNQQQR